MAKNKTTETDHSVDEYLNAISNEKRKNDCIEIISIISKETGLKPKMWGTAIVGFGSYHYKYDSGHEGDAPLVGFSSRASAISLYLATNFEAKETLLKDFGKHKVGKSCIYIQKLEDVDKNVLKKMILNSFLHMKKTYK